ncbi:MAG: hypothetical protein WDM81_20345 [Rhizomicrobium sp.]
MNGTASRAASRRPTELLPAPIMPTSATVRVSFMASAYTPFAFPASRSCLTACNSATNLKEFVMRSAYREPSGWGLRIVIGVGVLVLLAAVGLTVYGSRVEPARHPVELTVPNDQLPR